MWTRFKIIWGYIFLIFLTTTCIACQNPHYSDPPLHEAARRGNIKKLKTLLQEGHNINGENREGATPLHWAAFKGQKDAVIFLLKNGARVNARTKKGSTPLKLAQDYNQRDVEEVLKRAGAR